MPTADSEPRPGNGPAPLVLLALALAAAVLLWSSSALIVPFPASAPWYESAALFPRLMLALVIVGSFAELVVRAHSHRAAQPDTDELDSSSMDLRKAMLAVGLFMVYTFIVPWLGYATSTVLYVFGAGLLLGLPARHAAVLGIALSAITWLVFVHVLKVAFGHGVLP